MDSSRSIAHATDPEEADSPNAMTWQRSLAVSVSRSANAASGLRGLAKLVPSRDNLISEFVLDREQGSLAARVFESVVEKLGKHPLGATVIDHDGGDPEKVPHVGDLGPLAGVVSMELECQIKGLAELISVNHGVQLRPYLPDAVRVAGCGSGRKPDPWGGAQTRRRLELTGRLRAGLVLLR